MTFGASDRAGSSQDLPKEVLAELGPGGDDDGMRP